MSSQEALHLTAAVLVVTAVIGFAAVLEQQWLELPLAFFFAVTLVIATVIPKKLMAHALDVTVEHRIWSISRWGWASHRQLKPEIPAGIVLPLLLSLFSLGFLKIMPVLTYETTGLKTRAARKFGFFSYLTLTEWHTALIGAAGILAILGIAFISYFLPFEEFELLAKIAAYYALINLIPYSDLDGTHILMGSRVLWATLAALAAIFTLFAIVIQ